MLEGQNKKFKMLDINELSDACWVSLSLLMHYSLPVFVHLVLNPLSQVKSVDWTSRVRSLQLITHSQREHTNSSFFALIKRKLKL